MIRPTIVWALDEKAGVFVRNWLETIYGDEKRFVVAAASWEEVRDHLQKFNRVEVAAELLALGVGQVGKGTWASVVLVSYGMGSIACDGWAEAEQRLNSIQREVARLERHRIILARHRDHALEDRFVSTEGLLRVPWLLSDRTDRRQTLGDEAFQALVNRLLTVISTCFRRPGMPQDTPEGSFFGAPETAGSVKLLGTPEVALDEIVKEIAAACAVQTAYTAMCEARQASFESFMSPKRIGSFVDDVARGKKKVGEVEKVLFGASGFMGLPCSELICWGGKHAENIHDRFEAKIKSWHPPKRAYPETGSGCLFGPALVWLGFSKKVQIDSFSDTTHAMESDMLLVEFEGLLAALKTSAIYLKSVREWAHRLKPAIECHVPRSHRGRWLDSLNSHMQSSLTNIVKNRDEVNELSFDGVEYINEITSDFEQNLIQEIVNGDWIESHPQTKKLKLMDQGSFYIYSGCVVQGQSVPQGRGIVRADGPALDKAVFGRVEFWRGGPAAMILASRPIATKDLEW